MNSWYWTSRSHSLCWYVYVCVRLGCMERWKLCVRNKTEIEAVCVIVKERVCVHVVGFIAMAAKPHNSPWDPQDACCCLSHWPHACRVASPSHKEETESAIYCIYYSHTHTRPLAHKHASTPTHNHTHVHPCYGFQQQLQNHINIKRDILHVIYIHTVSGVCVMHHCHSRMKSSILSLIPNQCSRGSDLRYPSGL
jgi:hypothetical protein